MAMSVEKIDGTVISLNGKPVPDSYEPGESFTAVAEPTIMSDSEAKTIGKLKAKLAKKLCKANAEYARITARKSYSIETDCWAVRLTMTVLK